jgi:hypothetical protein
MTLSIASNYTQRFTRWTEWKAAYAIKGLPLQWEDDGELYSIWTYDGPEIILCQIWKTSLPQSVISVYSQVQNDLDLIDFEANYKSLGNKSLSQLDTDAAQIVRIKAAKKGWSFWAVPIEATTSTLGASLFLQDSTGANISWVTAKIYNESNDEITTAGLLNANLNTCVKTVIDFEPTFDFEVIGGSLRINNNPSQDVRLWIVVAPDIPAIYGGSKEFASGINLKFLSADSPLEVDGRVSKFISYNATDHRGRIRFIFKHPAGLQVNLMFVVEMYRQ